VGPTPLIRSERDVIVIGADVIQKVVVRKPIAGRGVNLANGENAVMK